MTEANRIQRGIRVKQAPLDDLGSMRARGISCFVNFSGSAYSVFCPVTVAFTLPMVLVLEAACVRSKTAVTLSAGQTHL